ncbi:MAG: hypothetical protein COA79_24375 [Planctomycetota bacterium]|nr:MAG: hypothetical protein COA79_24375 [Planctomycetota bacterium]
MKNILFVFMFLLVINSAFSRSIRRPNFVVSDQYSGKLIVASDSRKIIFMIDLKSKKSEIIIQDLPNFISEINVQNNILYVWSGFCGVSSILAFDLKSRKTLWQRSYSGGPYSLAAFTNSCFIVNVVDELIALSRVDGSELWRIKSVIDIITTNEDIIFGIKKENDLIKIDAQTGNILKSLSFKFHRLDQYHGVYDSKNKAIIFSSSHFIKSINIDTFEENWDAVKKSDIWSLNIVKDELVVGSYLQKGINVQSYEIEMRNHLTGKVMRSVVLKGMPFESSSRIIYVEGKLLIQTKFNLHCFSYETLKKEWDQYDKIFWLSKKSESILALHRSTDYWSANLSNLNLRNGKLSKLLSLSFPAPSHKKIWNDASITLLVCGLVILAIIVSILKLKFKMFSKKT